MSNITPSKSPDGNSIESFSQKARDNLNDDDNVEERTDLAASRVFVNNNTTETEEDAARNRVVSSEKSARNNLDIEKKQDLKSTRRAQAANRKPASLEDKERRKELDEQSKAASSEAVSEGRCREALKIQRKTQELIEMKDTLFSVSRSNQSMQKAASNTLDLLRIIDQIDVESFKHPKNLTTLIETAEKLLMLLRTIINPLDEHDLFIHSTLFHKYYKHLHELLIKVTDLDRVKHLTLRCFNNDDSPVVVKKNIKVLCEEWKRSMISATLVDCGFTDQILSSQQDNEESPTEESLSSQAQEIFNLKAEQHISINAKVIEDSSFPDHQLVEADFKFSSGEERKIQFYSAVVCSNILKRYTQISSELDISENQQIDPNLQVSVRRSFNCFSFATGYETENNEPLIPGALPKETKTHPIAWVSDKVLQDQGLIRIDSFLCKNLDYHFLKLENPVYLIAVIHSGMHNGRPDAHVLRCFYDLVDKQLVWLESGGTKRVKFRKGSDNKIVTGIPVNPKEIFCDGDSYPCFLGYYLVMDSVKLLDATGKRAQYVS